MTTSATADLPDPTWFAPPRPGPVGEVQAPRPDPAAPLPAPTARPASAMGAPPRPDPESYGPGPDRRGESRRGRSRRPRADSDDRRDWVVDLGIAVGGLAAIVASFTTLRHLGAYTGWGRLDWLLPTTLDTFVITTTRVWQSRRTKSAKVRQFAAGNAIGAIVLSLAGNAVYHAIHAGAWEPGQHMWLLVVLVSSIPPIAIGLISHLAVLRGRDSEFAAEEARQAGRPAPTAPQPAYPTPTQTAPVPAVAPDSTASPDPTPPLAEPAPTESTAPRPASTDPGPTDSDSPNPNQVERAGRKRPAPAPTGKGPDDPLLDEAVEYAAQHFERTGRKIGAEPLADHFKIGTKRSRLLRDAVHGIRAAESGGESGGDS